MNDIQSPGRHLAVGIAMTLFVTIAACHDTPTVPLRGALAPDAARAGVPADEPAPPAELASVTFGGGTLTLWPYTGDDFGEQKADPINAIFTGYADPLRIRAALRRLDGNRATFGLPAAAFDCTWRDAVGEEQTAFADPEQWTGSAVQLQCGEFGPTRLHVRLFGEGPWTLAGAHMDLHIAGTHDHEAISWEVAQEVLRVDMIRSGLLGAGTPGLSPVINATPTFRSIRLPVWNGMPVALKAFVGVLGGPAIPTDGRASLFDMTTPEAIVPDISTQDFVLQYNQTIPKPFCNGPNDYATVTGPLHFQSTARVTPGGVYERMYTVTGDLSVVAVNIATGELGPAQIAKIEERHEGSITPAGALARSFGLQRLFAADGTPRDVQTTLLHAGTRGHDEYRLDVRCGN